MEAGVILRARARGAVQGDAGRLRGKSTVDAIVVAKAA